MYVSGANLRVVFLAAVMLMATVTSVLQNRVAHAAQITDRKLTLQSGATDGGAKPGGVVNHFFEFTVPGGADVASIKFEYCTTASVDTCVTPTGLVTTNATLGSEDGATGFTLNRATNGAPYLTRTAASIAANTPLKYQLQSITNPTATNTTFFVRITTHGDTAATDTAIDSGSVAASTANDIVLTGVMPESLIFCTGRTITTNAGGIPDCTTATSGSITFNQLFSPTDTSTATSQMAASTNAGTGYVITVNGPTLTSGSNTIPAMASAGQGIRSTSQFGINLKANTAATSTTPVGAEVAPTSDAGVNLRGQATTGYDTVDNFKFVSGESVANSAFGGAGPTNAQIFTASYIVNVAGSQPAGTYTTTLTYVCTATF